MKVLLLGGDGYLGWPTAMYLSARGHEVVVVDNYFRRKACISHNLLPLFDIQKMNVRAELWLGKTGHNIQAIEGDITEYQFLSTLIKDVEPEAIIHYAEQPSAPYSMMNYATARYTLENNLTGTLNVAYAVKESNVETHIVKVGTMGEYGTPDIDIEEGFIEIEHKGRKDRFLFPRQASSLYHTTKIQDTDLLYFYVRTWGLRVTDLMQGPVYGLNTTEMAGDERLLTFFNYDSVFGTVVNRFIVQAAIGYPLTVYGSGKQKRGYLNLLDTLQCVELALNSPPSEGHFRVFNQFTETFSVMELAKKVVESAELIGLKSKIQYLENLRKESEDHYYNPTHTGLHDMGLVPHLLDEKVLVDMLEMVITYKDSVEPGIINKKVSWY